MYINMLYMCYYIYVTYIYQFKTEEKKKIHEIEVETEGLSLDTEQRYGKK